MARFYARRPGEARSVHGVMVRLWSDPHIPAIYALLLHRWLYLSQQAPGEAQEWSDSALFLYYILYLLLDPQGVPLLFLFFSQC
jgi:hypothetical protein